MKITFDPCGRYYLYGQNMLGEAILGRLFEFKKTICWPGLYAEPHLRLSAPSQEKHFHAHDQNHLHSQSLILAVLSHLF